MTIFENSFLNQHGIRSQKTFSAVRQAFTLLELLVVIAIIAILSALLLPAFSKAKLKAQNIVCVSQLRQLGLAVRMYADENDRLLPTAELLPSLPANPAAPLPRICDVLQPQLSRSSGTNSSPVFHCPGDLVGRFAQEGSSYEWNTDLNGHRIDETLSQNLKIINILIVNGAQVSQTDTNKQLLFPPVTTPLFLDYEDFHPRPPNSGKNVVFMDGHVSALNINELMNGGQ